jgi:hypothetical protein
LPPITRTPLDAAAQHRHRSLRIMPATRRQQESAHATRRPRMR